MNRTIWMFLLRKIIGNFPWPLTEPKSPYSADFIPIWHARDMLLPIRKYLCTTDYIAVMDLI